MNIVFTNLRGTFKGIGSFENENNGWLKRVAHIILFSLKSISREIRNIRSREGLIAEYSSRECLF